MAAVNLVIRACDAPHGPDRVEVDPGEEEKAEVFS